MTRPRSAQLNYPATRYTSYTLPVSPNPGTTQIFLPNPVTDFTVTKVTGGAETALPAALIATIGEPTAGFLIPVTGTLTVSMNDGTSASINLVQGTTVRLQQIIDSINNAFLALTPSVSVAVADRTFDQYLILRSANASGYIVGTGASVTITSNRIALLALFGFDVTNSATGVPLGRGVVTNAFDLFGGKVFFSRADGYDLMAVSNRVFPDFSAKDEFLPNFTSASRPDKRLYGRLVATDPSNVLAICRVEAYSAAPFKTTNANCAALTTGDSFETTITNRVSGRSVTFLTSITSNNPTSEDVATYVNDSFSLATDCTTPYWTSTVSEPFFLSGSFRLRFSGTYINVSLDSTLRNAQQVADKINADISVAGASSEGLASVLNGRVVIKSSSGTSSLVEISEISDSEFARALGIQNGQYRAYIICSAIGSELYFSLPFDCNLSFDNASLPSTLKNLGITNADVTSVALPVDTKEARAIFPNLTGSTSNSSELNYITIQIPELMEAGDVPADQFTDERETDFQSPYKRKQITIPSLYETSGTPVFNTDSGYLNESLFPYSISTGRVGQATFAQEFPDATYLPSPVVYSAIAKQGLTTVNYKLFAEIAPEDADQSFTRISTYNVSPRNSLILSTNSKPSVDSNILKYSLDRGSSPASALSIANDSIGVHFKDASSAEWDADSWTPSISLEKVEDTTYGISIIHAISLSDGGVFVQKDSSLKFSDANTQAESNVALKNIQLTSIDGTNGDSVLRVGNLPAVTNVQTYSGDRYSIVRSLNSRNTITCGDGISTFGDFNGPVAISEIADFITSNSISDAHIIVKPGVYTTLNTIAFQNANITIEGYGATVSASGSSAAQLTFTNTADGKGVLKIYGLNFATNSNYNLNAQNGYIHLEDCSFNSGIYLAASASTTPNYSQLGIRALYAKNCFFKAGGSYDSCVEITKASTSNVLANSIIFDQCYFDPRDSGNDKRVCIVSGLAGAYASMTFKDIAFNNCEFKLSSYTAQGDNRMNVNVGLIELNPATNIRNASGLRISRLSYDSCTVDATNTGLNCLMQLSSGLTTNTVTASSNYAIVDELYMNNMDMRLRLSSTSISNYSLGFVIGHSVQKCVFVNNKIAYTNGNNDCGYGARPTWMAFAGANLAASSFGHISFISKQTIIENFDVTGCVAGSTRSVLYGADLSLAFGTKLKVNNVNLSWTKPDGTISNGDGTISPRCRVAVQKIYTVSSPIYDENGTAVIENLNLIGPNSTPTLRWADSAIIYNVANNVTYRNVTCKSFLNASVTGTTYGIHVYTANSYAQLGSNVSIAESNFDGFDRGVVVTNVSTTPGENISITNNKIRSLPTGSGNTKSQGIQVIMQNTQVGFGGLKILANSIETTGLSYSGSAPISGSSYYNESAGILITTRISVDPLSRKNARKIIKDNVIKTTDTAAGSRLIPGIWLVPWPGSSDSGNETAICSGNSVMSNYFAGPEYWTGRIAITGYDASANAFVPVISPILPSYGLVGVETGYAVVGSETVSNLLADGADTVHNFSRLLNYSAPA
jgi:hypothetical protein